MPGKHSRFSPSATTRWIQCPASVPLTEQLREQGRIASVDPESIHSLRGTLIHTLVERALRTHAEGINMEWKDDAEIQSIWDRADGALDRTDIMHTAEGILQTMRQVLGQDPHASNPESVHDYIEQRVEIDSPVETGGTPDFVRIRETAGEHELLVLDIKTGAWKVSPVDNPQLKTYAYLVARHHEMDMDAPIKITLGIIQPDLEGNTRFESWDTTIEVVRKFVEHDVTHAIQQAALEEPPFNPGIEQCRFCPAKAFCPGLNQLSERLLLEKADMQTMTDSQIAEFYDRLAVLTNVKTEIEKNIKEGRSVRGFEIRPGYQRGKWATWGSAKMQEFLTQASMDEQDFQSQFTEIVPIAPSKFKKESPDAFKAAVDSGAIKFQETAPRVIRVEPSLTDDDASSFADA